MQGGSCLTRDVAFLSAIVDREVDKVGHCRFRWQQEDVYGYEEGRLSAYLGCDYCFHENERVPGPTVVTTYLTVTLVNSSACSRWDRNLQMHCVVGSRGHAVYSVLHRLVAGIVDKQDTYTDVNDFPTKFATSVLRRNKIFAQNDD